MFYTYTNVHVLIVQGNGALLVQEIHIYYTGADN